MRICFPKIKKFRPSAAMICKSGNTELGSVPYGWLICLDEDIFLPNTSMVAQWVEIRKKIQFREAILFASKVRSMQCFSKCQMKWPWWNKFNKHKLFITLFFTFLAHWWLVDWLGLDENYHHNCTRRRPPKERQDITPTVYCSHSNIPAYMTGRIWHILTIICGNKPVCNSVVYE